jgi:hypothetical protein
MFGTVHDATEMLTDLLMQEGNDIFSVGPSVEAIIKRHQPKTTYLQLLQLYDCFTNDTLDLLPLKLSQLLEPTRDRADHDLGDYILEGFGKSMVDEYRRAIEMGTVPDPLMQHAYELSGV